MSVFWLTKTKLFAFGLCFCSLTFSSLTSKAIPPPEDLPEEVLATQIILEARSDIDNRSLTVEEYAREEIARRERAFPPEIDSNLRHKIYLIPLLKLLRTIVPTDN